MDSSHDFANVSQPSDKLDDKQKIYAGKDLNLFKANIQRHKTRLNMDRINVYFGKKDEDGNVRMGKQVPVTPSR